MRIEASRNGPAIDRGGSVTGELDGEPNQESRGETLATPIDSSTC